MKREPTIPLLSIILVCAPWTVCADDTAIFHDATLETGLDFVHFNGMSGRLYLAEIMGPGAAFLDFDNDGDLDVYLGQGHELGHPPAGVDTLTTAANEPTLRDRLYRNDLFISSNGQRTLSFTDVTVEAGLDAAGYATGVATGDYDNDGDVDLYITNFGANQLWRNNGDGSFSDVTAAAGAGDTRWSTSALFLDYDRDGFEDLYIVNYLDHSLHNNRQCFARTGSPDYCGPTAYRPVSDRLLHNERNGRFRDVSPSSGIGKESGAGLGGVVADFNRDGWADIYVANDGMENYLWINKGNGTFANDALLSGAAVNMKGKAEASMGVDAGDFDNDGDDDLFMTHLDRETNTLFRNDGDGVFTDISGSSGLGRPSWNSTGFGTAWIDYDNDGWLDLVIVNGAVKFLPELARAGDPFPLGQSNQLFHNLGDGKFEETSSAGGMTFLMREISRAAATGDVDKDGDVDVLYTNNNGRARLLLNTSGTANHWLGLRLLDRQSKRDVSGAEVEVLNQGRLALRRRSGTDGGYGAANDPRILIGLGSHAGPVDLRVYWPDGTREDWRQCAADRYHNLSQGGGLSLGAPR